MKSKLTSTMIFSLALLGVLFVFNNSLAEVSISTGLQFSGSNFNVSMGFGSGSGSGSGWTLGDSFGLPASSVTGIITGILNWILAIIGIVAIIAFAISGIMYLISAGNEDMTKKAKSALVASIIGVIVALSGFIIIRAVTVILDGGFGVV